MSKDAEVAAQARLASFLQKIDGLEADDNEGLVALLQAKTAKGWNALMIAARHQGDKVTQILATAARLGAKEESTVLVDMLSAVNSGGGSALLFAAEFSPQALEPLVLAIKKLQEPHASDILRKVLLVKVDHKRNAMQQLTHADPAKAKNLLLDLRWVNLLMKSIYILKSSFVSILKQLKMSEASRDHWSSVHTSLTRRLSLSGYEEDLLIRWLVFKDADEEAEKAALLLARPSFVVKAGLMKAITRLMAQRGTLRLLKMLLSPSQRESVNSHDQQHAEGGKSFDELVAWIRDSQMVPQERRPIMKTILAGYQKQLKMVGKSAVMEASC